MRGRRPGIVAVLVLAGGMGLPADTDVSAPRASRAEEEGPLVAGVAGVSNPTRIKGEQPRYPEEARAEGVEGKVFMQAVIIKDGSVGEVQVLSCNETGYGFEEAATKAVKTWVYKPARRKGEPVEVYFNIVVTFTLKR